jgi:hypothetical protein
VERAAYPTRAVEGRSWAAEAVATEAVVAEGVVVKAVAVMVAVAGSGVKAAARAARAC